MGVITEEARRWAEREYADVTLPVTRTDIRRYARAIGADDPIHHDPEAARAAGFADLVAPPLFPYALRTHAATLVPRSELREDGSPLADVPPLPTERAMAGETTIELGEPVVAGTTVTIRKELVDLSEKEGRSGPLVFVTMRYTFLDEAGATLATETFTRIYR